MKRILLFLLLVIGLTTYKVAADDEFSIAAKGAIAVDVTSGKILYEKDSQSPIEVGSISNLLTTYLVYEAIDKGQFNMDSFVDISDNAYYLTNNIDFTNLSMEARRYKVRDLLQASLLASSHGATVALAEKVAGSEDKFVQMMNAKLQEWGIADATLVNSSGLNTKLVEEETTTKTDTEKATENKFSAYDVAVIARHLITDFPKVTDITSKVKGDFSGIELDNYNYMLKDQPNFRLGVDGLKAGSSETDGISFVASTTQDGMRLITVVLGVDEIDGDPYAPFVATASLMNYIAQHYTQTTILKAGDAYEDSKVNITDGKKATIPAVAEKDFKVIQRIGSQADYKISFTSLKKTYLAPISKKTKVGTLTYEDPELVGQGYLENKQPSISMVPSKKVEKSIFLKVWWNQFVRFVNEKL